MVADWCFSSVFKKKLKKHAPAETARGEQSPAAPSRCCPTPAVERAPARALRIPHSAGFSAITWHFVSGTHSMRWSNCIASCSTEAESFLLLWFRTIGNVASVTIGHRISHILGDKGSAGPSEFWVALCSYRGRCLDNHWASWLVFITLSHSSCDFKVNISLLKKYNFKVTIPLLRYFICFKLFLDKSLNRYVRNFYANPMKQVK